MTLEDRLERLANRTSPGNPEDVLAAARRQADAPTGRRPAPQRLLTAAAAVIAVLAVAAGAIALTSGDGDTVTVAGPDSPASLDGQWLLTATVTDNEIRTAQAQASVTIDGDTVTGDDGCGNAAKAELSDGRIAGDGLHTLEGCVEEPGSYDANRFWHVIEQQPRYEIRGRELWLLADDGDALVFVRADSVPTEHASPVGEWELDSLSADGEGLDFSKSNRDPWIDIGGDGTLAGAFPCNSFGGTVKVLDTTLDVEDFGQELVGCEGPEGAAERALSRLLDSDPTWEIRDGVLLLSGAGVDASFSGRSRPKQRTPSGGVEGPVMYGPEQHGERVELALLSGRLLHEGDCLYLLQESDAARYAPLPVVWPYGATWQDSPEGVLLAGGTFVPVGTTFTASGGIHDIGRLGELGHAESVAERAQGCGADVPAVAYVQGEVSVGEVDPVVEGDTAVWDVDAAIPPAPSSTYFTVMVTRLGCNGGETGKVLEPDVSADGEQVVVTFSVEPMSGGDCPSNNSVRYVVELGEPLGDRDLVDGACLAGEAAATSFCSEGAVRWPPPA
jgi:heat shock protein HslJ